MKKIASAAVLLMFIMSFTAFSDDVYDENIIDSEYEADFLNASYSPFSLSSASTQGGYLDKLFRDSVTRFETDFSMNVSGNDDPNARWANFPGGSSIVQEPSGNKYLNINLTTSTTELRTPSIGKLQNPNFTAADNYMKVVMFRMKSPVAAGIGGEANAGTLIGQYRENDGSSGQGPQVFTMKDKDIVTNQSTRFLGSFNPGTWQDYVMLMEFRPNANGTGNYFRITLYIDGVNQNEKNTNPHADSYSGSNDVTRAWDTWFRFQMSNYQSKCSDNNVRLDYFRAFDPVSLKLQETDLGEIKVSNTFVVIPFNNLLSTKKINDNMVRLYKNGTDLVAGTTVEPYSTVDLTNNGYFNALKVNFPGNLEELTDYTVEIENTDTNNTLLDYIGTALAPGENVVTFSTSESTDTIIVKNSGKTLEAPLSGEFNYKMKADVQNKFFQDVTASTPLVWEKIGSAPNGVTVSDDGVITLAAGAGLGELKLRVYERDNPDVEEFATFTVVREEGMKAWTKAGSGSNPANVLIDNETCFEGRGSSDLLIRLGPNPVSFNKLKLKFNKLYSGKTRISYSDTLSGIEPAVAMEYDNFVTLDNPQVLFSNAQTVNRMLNNITAKYILLSFDRDVSLSFFKVSNAPVDNLSILTSSANMNIPLTGETTRALIAKITDTENEDVDGRTVIWSLEEPVSGISLRGNNLIVLPNAQDGSVVSIEAKIEGTDISANINIILTTDIVNLAKGAIVWNNGSAYGNPININDENDNTSVNFGARNGNGTIAVKLSHVPIKLNKVVIKFGNPWVKEYSIMTADNHPSIEPEQSGSPAEGSGISPIFNYETAQRVVHVTTKPDQNTVEHYFDTIECKYLYLYVTFLNNAEALTINEMEVYNVSPYFIEFENEGDIYIPPSGTYTWDLPKAVVCDTGRFPINFGEMQNVEWKVNGTLPAGVTADFDKGTITVSSGTTPSTVSFLCTSLYPDTPNLSSQLNINLVNMSGDLLKAYKDYSALIWEKIAANQLMNAVYADIELPITSENGSVIEWNSNSPAFIIEEISEEDEETGLTVIKKVIGKVANRVTSKVDATLTAKITNGVSSLERKFNINVVPVPSDKAKAELDASWLTNERIGNVGTPTTLTLYTALPNGSTASWSSSNENAVSTANGSIRKVTYKADSRVTLTADIRYGGYTQRTQFTVNVPYDSEGPVTGNPPGGGGGGGGFSLPMPKPAENDTGDVQSENTGGEESKIAIFNDLHGFEWAEQYFNALFDMKIISGTGYGNVEPARGVTREEFVKMLVCAFNIESDNSDGASNFEDIAHNEWYYDYINTAMGAGIIYGISPTEFGIGRNIARQDMMVLVYRAMLNSGKEILVPDGVLNFSDADDVSEYAKDAVEVMHGSGIINGYEDGSFRPRDFADRAAAAKIIYKVIELAEVLK